MAATNHAADLSRREDASAVDYLTELGARVRAARARRGMTRKILANDSGVSERYLAKLETGEGNISVLVLRQIADAMDMKMLDLVSVGEQLSPQMQSLYQLARQMTDQELAQANLILKEAMGRKAGRAKAKRISLIGLRGAGKSTLGPLLSEKLGFEFVELNKRIENEFGATLAEIFSLAGQPSFRRFERRCLQDIIDSHDNIVISTGGSIVADEKTFSLLLQHTHVIWLQATPDEHMSRVVEQGDLRPMAGSEEAMADLRQILSAREPLYGRADDVCNTAGRTVNETAQDLHQIAERLLTSVSAQSA
ncbi:MAG: helix-turn-helix transcriptional regulator [Sneathiella sp.]|uniref:helix-turn-helix transcriptional regulator n=1 Tax=Sneathiella sp. TaxID=1964365 RepID=UPI0030024735